MPDRIRFEYYRPLRYMRSKLYLHGGIEFRVGVSKTPKIRALGPMCARLEPVKEINGGRL